MIILIYNICPFIDYYSPKYFKEPKNNFINKVREIKNKNDTRRDGELESAITCLGKYFRIRRHL